MPFIDNQLGVLVKRGEVVNLDRFWYCIRVKDTEEPGEGISDKVHLLDTLQLAQVISVYFNPCANTVFESFLP